MSDPFSRNPGHHDPIDELAPVLDDDGRRQRGTWTDRLVLFLRVMAAFSMLKGLYHWAAVCGFTGMADGGFEARTSSWQAATVFFAVIDLVAAVGLWLAAPWGAVVWLTASVSVVVIDFFFPQIYGEQILFALLVAALIGAYLFFAVQSAREHGP